MPECETPSFFQQTIDAVVEFALEHDQELVDGIKWLDEQAFKKGITFYDICNQVLEKHEINSKAKSWMKSKNGN